MQRVTAGRPVEGAFRAMGVRWEFTKANRARIRGRAGGDGAVLLKSQGAWRVLQPATPKQARQA